MSPQTFHYSVVSLSFLLLITASIASFQALFPNEELSFAVYTLVLLACLSIQIVERYFTKPGDVVINSAGLLLVLLPLKFTGLGDSIAYNFLVGWSCLALLTAVLSSMLFQADSPDSVSGRLSRVLKEISVKVGAGRIMYSFSIFVLILNSGAEISSFFVAAIVVLLLNVVLDRNPFPNLLVWRKEAREHLGFVSGTLGGDVYKIKFPNKTTVPRLVQFKKNGTRLAGVVVNSHLSTDGLELEVLRAPVDQSLFDDRTVKEGEAFSLDGTDTGNAIGYVSSGTSVSELKFLPLASAEVDVGNIVEVEQRDQSIFYQIQDAEIRYEQIDSSNKGDLVVASAAQLGTYNSDTQIFERFDWLPKATSIVKNPTTFPQAEIQEGEYTAGHFPGTNFPVYLNVEETVTHHCAVLGVTGTGKSVFCREFIRQTSNQKIKYICVDITNEYLNRFGDDIVSLVPEATAKALSPKIEYLYKQRQEFANKREHAKVQQTAKEVLELFKPVVKQFVDGEKSIGLVEFADLSGTIQNFEYLKWFFHSLFELAKEGEFGDTTICIVLEEAHTIVPEWNFVADNDKAISSLLNSISQIALQGRKYGVGLMVIAQRTANVSKTILTQCNTVIAFQQFDKTSSDFLESFVGGDAGRILPNLKPRTAIATGKGLRSSTPVIFAVPTIEEPGERLAETVSEGESASAQDA